MANFLNLVKKIEKWCSKNMKNDMVKILRNDMVKILRNDAVEILSNDVVNDIEKWRISPAVHLIFLTGS